METQNYWYFQPNSSIYLVGMSGCGKSSFALKLLENHCALLGGSPENPPKSITYLYNIHNPMVDIISHLPNSTVRQGLDPEIINTPEKFFGTPTEKQLKHLGHVLIVDDLGVEFSDSPAFTKLFTQGVKHLGITLIVMVHSLFFPGKDRKLQQNNANYIVLFKSPRALASVAHMSRQLAIGNPKKLLFAYQSICELEYIPLIVDLGIQTHPELMLVSHIFPDQYPVNVYL